MDDDDPKPDLLRKAAALVGRDQLADALEVRPTLLDAWMSGDVPVPARTFERLVSVLVRLSTPKH